MKSFLLLLIILHSAVAFSGDLIMWGLFHRPPSVDITDINNPAGLTGDLLQLLESEMPDYEHMHINMNLGRILKDIQDGEHVCNNSLFKSSAREQYSYFSLPYRINLPLRVVMTKAAYEKIGSPASISLEDLLRSRRLIGVAEQNRSYSQLDNIIDRGVTTGAISKEVLTSSQMVKMLLLNRIDYFIEYSFIVNYIMEQSGEEAESDIVFIPIEETWKFAFSHVICPKTEWGRHIIERVNIALHNIVAKDNFLSVLQSIYKNPHEKDKIKQIYHDELLKYYE